ncbi:MAG: exonuclease domain-containing protein [Candidatus Omnitrophota bacterium]
MTLNEIPLVITDIETTGGRYHNHRIIEIGMIKVVNGRKVEEFQSLIDPQCQIPANITTLTGITNEMVGKAPTFSVLHESIYEFLEGSVFVAHNARFDYGFIRQEFERLGIRYKSKILCSLKLSRKLFPKFKRHDVSSIMQRYGIEVENRHRALDDARVVWGFLQVVQEKTSLEKQSLAIEEIIRQPALPPHLKTDIDDIPELPGVYFFLNEAGVPLYIGKAKNLRTRIMAHFNNTLHSNQEIDLSRNVTGITIVQTQGELAALLLESYYIKTQFPLYNKRSRRNLQLTVVKLDDSEEYHKIYFEGREEICKEDLKNILAVFRTKRDTQRYLENLAREYKLCKTLLNLEKSKSDDSCFYYQINQCKGACIQKESSLKYNLRLKEAFLEKQRLEWPFDGALMIEEHNEDKTKGEVIIIDSWIIQNAFRYDMDQKENLFPCNGRFDLDVFRILYGYVNRRKNLNLKVIRPDDLAEEI